MNLNEPIDEILRLAGETLSFPGFTILGFPGFSISAMYGGEATVYSSERQEFSFMVSSKDCDTNVIVEGDSFTYNDTCSIHTFVLQANPRPDLTGWSKLNVIWQGKSSV